MAQSKLDPNAPELVGVVLVGHDHCASSRVGSLPRPSAACPEATASPLVLHITVCTWIDVLCQGVLVCLTFIGFQVQVTGVGTTRESLATNEAVLTPALKHLGMRPSVQTCMLHVKSLYELMDLPIPGTLTRMIHFWQPSKS